jgi:ATP-dependent DNA helicase DinG
MLDGEAILKRINRETADALRNHIEQAGGREVFFAGTLDAAGLVVEVRVLARGHAEAVPALFTQLMLRDVVIHNHPSGDLTPSDADLELASIYSTHGHGVYIIDNEATRVYAVIEPFLPKAVVKLTERELSRAFSEESPLARGLDGYEPRPQQIAMATTIGKAFNDNGIAIIEAPTGVGKTMSYLLPSIYWALRNKERVVISTRTINLQEQIMFHDLPLLQRCLKENFQACLVKGRGNYICRHKLDRAYSEISLFEDEDRSNQLRAISEWVENTRDGSSSDLPFVPAWAVWEQVNCESDVCLGASCRYFRNCFFMNARKEMARADLLIANHHMLFADVAVKKEMGDFTAAAVLPRYSRVILDEAHSIEDAATEYFGLSATLGGMRKVMSKLYRREYEQERGLLSFLKLKLMRNCPQVTTEEYNAYITLIDKKIQPALVLCQEALEEAFFSIREYTAEKAGQIGRDIKWRLTPDILADMELRELHEEIIVPAVNQTWVLIRLAEQLHEKLQGILPLEAGEESPVQLETAELSAYLRRLQGIAETLNECTQEELVDNTVRWIEIDGRDEERIRIARCPLSVGKPLAEWVYSHMDTVILTSATLAVEQRFNYFMHRVGLNLVSNNRVQTRLLDTPFNYSQQSLVCVPTDGVDPKDPAFLDDSVEQIRKVLHITRGHAFVLFTSFYALDYTARKLEEELKQKGIQLLCQGKANRSHLLAEFRRDSSSVLFGTDSFWEGVDVAGEALQCVIVTKLPFRVPSEPVLEARAEAIEQEGGNSFMQYSVPQAVIKMRQGFGRLIRRRSDWGAVVVLDNRIINKFYGKVFLKSLPKVPILQGEGESVWEQLAEFYESRRSDL